MKKILWLDDWRDPAYHAPTFDGQIHWVKNYQEFDAWLQENGLPDAVSFDLSLGGSQQNNNGVDGGMWCAKAMLRKCLREGAKFPEYRVHSEHEDAPAFRKYLESEIERKGL